MKKLLGVSSFMALVSMAVVLIYGSIGWAEEPLPAELPQEFVVCTGWHALCTASPDCKMHGHTAGCDCLRVKPILLKHLQSRILRSNA